MSKSSYPPSMILVAIRDRLVIGRERHEILTAHGWYKNIVGGWTHPHLMDWMPRSQILKLTPAQLEYKLTHGSKSELPDTLK